MMFEYKHIYVVIAVSILLVVLIGILMTMPKPIPTIPVEHKVTIDLKGIDVNASSLEKYITEENIRKLVEILKNVASETSSQ